MVKGRRAAVDAKVNATRVVQCYVAVASCGPYLHYLHTDYVLADPNRGRCCYHRLPHVRPAKQHTRLPAKTLQTASMTGCVWSKRPRCEPRCMRSFMHTCAATPLPLCAACTCTWLCCTAAGTRALAPILSTVLLPLPPLCRCGLGVP
jgi:hypothetical protein